MPYSYSGTMGLIQHDAYHALFYLLGTSELERTICSSAKGYGWKNVMGATLTMRPQEAGDSDMVILWSLSMLSTNVHFYKDVMEAKKKGAAVWCIDTYETKTAQLADHFVRVRPGRDGALALGIMYCLNRDGLCDEDFLRQYVRGWEELKERVLPKYDPAYVEKETGVPQTLLEELAKAYGTAKAPFIRLGTGMSRYTNGAMTTRLIACLPAVVGAWRHRGGGLLGSTSASSVFHSDAVVQRASWKKSVRRVNMCRIGEALLQKEGPIRSLYVYSSNPACTAPDQNQVLAGLSRDDLFTVVHERFMTDTARYADIVLPATTSLEHGDVYYSYGHYTIGWAKAVMEPLGQSRSNWNTARTLAKAMGFSDPFFDKTEDDLARELIATATWPLPFDKESLLAGKFIELPLPEGHKLQFKTPSGKIEIRSDSEGLPDYFPPQGEEGQYDFVNGTDPRILDSSFNEREELTRSDTMMLFMHPDDAAGEGLQDGQPVVVWNERGEAVFTLRVTGRTAPGQVVSEGVWWIEHALGDRSVNALTSQRLSDRGRGSTFYDVKVNVRPYRQM